MININIKPANSDKVSTINFTHDQQVAYNGLIDFINSDFSDKDYKRALVGPAGTGKTYLIRAIIQNCNMSYSVIGLSAPTHKACRVLSESIKNRNVKVNTLQSDLGLRLNCNIENFNINSPNFDPRGKIKIGSYKVYIIDEASMINRDLVLFIEKLVKQHKCKLIYIGDSSQLSPVNERYSSAFRNVTTYTLKQIVRQGEDNPISKLLEMLRYDIKNRTFTFLEYISRNPYKFNELGTKGYAVCNPEKFKELVYTNFNDEAFTKNVDLTKVVAYTNVRVNAWNNFIRNSIIEGSDKSVITHNDLIISYATIVNQFNECIIKNSEEYVIKEVVNYIHPKYNIKGFQVRLIAIHGGQVTPPFFVLDHTDNFSVQMYAKVSEELISAARKAGSSTRSERWKEYFKFKEGCLLLTNVMKPNGEILYSRDLDYGFALTAHKSQGSTFNVALVDVNNIIYDKYGQLYTDVEEINRRLYVACSRAKDKLYLCYGL